jgi:hypothetical protein
MVATVRRKLDNMQWWSLSPEPLAMLSIVATIIGIWRSRFWLHRAEADVIEKEAMGTRRPAHTEAGTSLPVAITLMCGGFGILHSHAPVPSGSPLRWMIIPLPSSFGSIVIRSALHELQRGSPDYSQKPGQSHWQQDSFGQATCRQVEPGWQSPSFWQRHSPGWYVIETSVIVTGELLETTDLLGSHHSFISTSLLLRKLVAASLASRPDASGGGDGDGERGAASSARAPMVPESAHDALPESRAVQWLC